MCLSLWYIHCISTLHWEVVRNVLEKHRQSQFYVAYIIYTVLRLHIEFLAYVELMNRMINICLAHLFIDCLFFLIKLGALLTFCCKAANTKLWDQLFTVTE